MLNITKAFLFLVLGINSNESLSLFAVTCRLLLAFFCVACGSRCALWSFVFDFGSNGQLCSSAALTISTVDVCLLFFD